MKLQTQSATVRQAFLVLDKDRSGTITGHELRRVLDRFALRLPAEHFHSLMDQYDTNKDGVIDYAEFMAAFGLAIQPKETGGVGMNLQNKAKGRVVLDALPRTRRPCLPALDVKTKPMDMMALHQRIRKSVTLTMQSLARSFQRMDSETDGTVTAQEFIGVLAAHSILKAASQEVLYLASQYGSNDVNGRVSYKRFLGAFKGADGNAVVSKQVRVFPVHAVQCNAA